MNTNHYEIIDFSSEAGPAGLPSEELSQLESVTQVPTAAERARERKLRDDPMALVLGPLNVDCRRCGAHIKLSKKSLYDPLHWRMHRTRCLKRLKAGERKEAISRMPNARPPSQGTSSAVERSVDPSSPDDQDSSPLTTEDEHEPPSNSTSARSSRQPTVAPPSARSDPICEEYIRRYHGKAAEEPLASDENWKDWSWTRLSLPPVFSAASQLQDDSL